MRLSQRTSALFFHHSVAFESEVQFLLFYIDILPCFCCDVLIILPHLPM